MITTDDMRALADLHYPARVCCDDVQCEARRNDYRGRYVFSTWGIVIPQWHAAEMLRARRLTTAVIRP